MTPTQEIKIESYQKYLVKKLILNSIAQEKYYKLIGFTHNHLENQTKLKRYMNTLKMTE